MRRERLLAGVVGGLLGGVLFAVLLQATDRIATVGRLVGAEGVATGWLTLLVITAVLGLVYGATFGRMAHPWGNAALFGFAHGVIWWVLAVLLIQPAVLGSAFGAFTAATWINLIGYLIHGVAAGLVTAALAQRSEATAPATSG